MQQGNDPSLIFDDDGALVALATGADACTEHECGSRSLQDALCDSVSSELAVIAALRAGRLTAYPKLLESKRIRRQPRELQWLERAQPEPEAVLGFAARPLETYLECLKFANYRGASELNAAGAWDERSFAFRVRGERYVRALRDLNTALHAGHVAFAGLFLDRPKPLSGVVLADIRRLNPLDLAKLESAQRRNDSKLRLKARDDTALLAVEMGKLAGHRNFGHLWPLWSDSRETDLVYGLNPWFRAKAQYYGPYTRAELLAWAAAKYEYLLMPGKKVA